MPTKRNPTPLPIRPLVDVRARRLIDLRPPAARQGPPKHEHLVEKVNREEAEKLDLAERIRIGRTAKAIGKHFAAALAAMLDRLTDDTYNAAVMANPAIMVASHGKAQVVQATAVDTAVKVYHNRMMVPVVVYVRADNANHDVIGISATTSDGKYLEGQVQGTNAIACLLRPAQALFVNVNASTIDGSNPVTLTVTSMALRGKAGVFGG